MEVTDAVVEAVRWALGDDDVLEQPLPEPPRWVGEADIEAFALALGTEAVALALAMEGVGPLVVEGASLAPALTDAILVLALGEGLSRGEAEALRLANGEREVLAEAESVAGALLEREEVGQDDTVGETQGVAEAEEQAEGGRETRGEVVAVGEEEGEDWPETEACESEGRGEFDSVPPPMLGVMPAEAVVWD